MRRTFAVRERFMRHSAFMSCSVTSVGKAEMYFSSGKLCFWIFAAEEQNFFCYSSSAAEHPEDQHQIPQLFTIYNWDKTKCIVLVVIAPLLLLQWVHLLLLVSNGAVDVIPQRLRLLLLIAQTALDQLQFLPQLSGVEPIWTYVAVCALQLWAERYQVMMELLDLRVKAITIMCVYLIIG